MDVRKGYKLTEVGIVPKDWNLPQLGTHFTFKNGINKGKEYFGYGTPIVNYMDVYGQNSIRANKLRGRVKVAKQELESFSVKRGDVFFTRTSETVEEIGFASVMLDEPCDTVFSGFLLRARPKTDAIAESFKRYCFSSNIIRQQITSKSTYTTRALTNGRVLSNVLLPLPPTKAEQDAIANALSDADALIEALEQLIAKKRNIKQGAMQELLTGKKRLPGFSGEWAVKRLGEIAQVVMGQSPSSKHYNNRGEGLPLIQGNADIEDRKTIKRIFTTEITKRGQFGDVLMSVRAPVGEISRTKFDVCLGRGVCALRYSNDYLYHAMIVNEPAWTRLSKGSTFDSVNSSDVKAFEVKMPLDNGEQTAISTILSDMDTEIAALESKLAKSRQIKQGMMQELLTGRIRLV